MTRPRSPHGGISDNAPTTHSGHADTDGATSARRLRATTGTSSVSAAQRATFESAQAGRPGATRTRTRPDVNSVPRGQRGDPRYDPAHPRYDGQPHGEHGNVGTVDPDTPSSTELTDSGRLHDPNVVPPELQPYLDSGAIINDNGVLRLAEPVDVEFTRSNPNHDPGEFNRQVGLQEQALNQQSAQSWAQNRDTYAAGGRQESHAQQEYREQQIQRTAEGYQRDNPGMAPEQARARAEADMQGQVVLHGPDQVAGGNPLQYTGMGDAGVNSSLGRQWGGRTGQALVLRDQLNDALAQSGIPHELWGDIRVNVRMNTRDTVS